eukprot:1023474-Pyramimonas_sp.AAC.1
MRRPGAPDARARADARGCPPRERFAAPGTAPETSRTGAAAGDRTEREAPRSQSRPKKAATAWP